MNVDDPFVATPKALAEPLDWRPRHRTSAHVATTTIEAGGLIVGDVIAVQRGSHPRHWSFTLRAQGRAVLRWDYEPPGKLRKHRNPKPTPPGFPANDRSLAHEHPWLDGGYDQFSRSLDPEHETEDHQKAFASFCERSNIVAGSHYRYPPDVQLPLEPS